MAGFAHPAESQWQTVSLNEVVEQALGMVRFDTRMKKVKLDADLSPEAGSLRLLPQALQQVLVNLLRNALDAMSDTLEPRLAVRTFRHSGWAIIEVADNGSGIKAEHMDRLFEPFFTTKPVGKGTGLGLSISYRLIEQQGGYIDVKSKPGDGAAFRVHLPAATPRTRSGSGVFRIAAS
jgi:C4-dicarboxylate-specific signal transduction histidine kinase